MDIGGFRAALPRPHPGEFDFQAETQKRSDEHNSRENCDGLERRADGHGSHDVRRDEEFETDQDCASNLLPKTVVHLGLAPPEPARGQEDSQPDATCDRHHAGDIDASADRFDRLVGAHAFTLRAINPSVECSRPLLRLQCREHLTSQG